jgi:hypothetical protein
VVEAEADSAILFTAGQDEAPLAWGASSRLVPNDALRGRRQHPPPALPGNQGSDERERPKGAAGTDARLDPVEAARPGRREGRLSRRQIDPSVVRPQLDGVGDIRARVERRQPRGACSIAQNGFRWSEPASIRASGLPGNSDR